MAGFLSIKKRKCDDCTGPHVWDRNCVFKLWVEESREPEGNISRWEDWDSLWPSVSLSERTGKDGGGCGEKDGVGRDLTGEASPNFKGEQKGDEDWGSRVARKNKTHKDIQGGIDTRRRIGGWDRWRGGEVSPLATNQWSLACFPVFFCSLIFHWSYQAQEPCKYIIRINPAMWLICRSSRMTKLAAAIHRA